MGPSTSGSVRWWESHARHWKLTTAIIAALGVVVAAVVGGLNYLKDSPAPSATATVPATGKPASPDDQPQCQYRDGSIGKTCVVVKAVGEGRTYGPETTTEFGDFVSVSVTYVNSSDSQQDNVSMSLHIDGEGMQLVPGTTLLFVDTTPTGGQVPDQILDPGINIGNYAHGGGAGVSALFSLHRPQTFSCGSIVITVHLIIWTTAAQVEDNATVRANLKC